ncbi:MAG: hypothetical protein U5K75_05240 [Ahrensia sp.]|nr:hypothetical protein [Ahrensia sp.]
MNVDASRLKIQFCAQKSDGLTSRVNQLEALANADGQMSIIWSHGETKPTVSGQLEQGAGIPTVSAQVLAFGRWLEPNSAVRIEHAIDALRQNAAPFADIVTTLKGTPIEIAGRTSGGAAVIRLSNLSHERTAHAKLVNAHERIVNTVETLQMLMDKIEMPIWIRSGDGSLAWVNTNFAKAVECKDSDDVIERSAELFGGQALRQITEKRQAQGVFSGGALDNCCWWRSSRL